MRTAWLTVAVAAVLAGVAVVLALAGLTQPAAWAVAAPLGAASYALWNRGRDRMIADLYDFDFEVEDRRRRETTEDWHRDWPPDDVDADVDTGDGDVDEPWEDWEWAREAARDRDSDDRTAPAGGGRRRRNRDPGGDGDWYPNGNRRERGGWSPSTGATDGGREGLRTVDPEVAEARRILGIDADADEGAIREAYRERVKETHPDAGGSREAFERVQWAYERLTDGDGSTSGSRG